MDLDSFYQYDKLNSCKTSRLLLGLGLSLEEADFAKKI